MKNIYKIIFLIICLSSALVQCTNEPRLSGSFQSIDFGEVTKESNIFVDILQYTQLQTTEQSLIGEVSQLEMSKDKIFILDRKTNSFFVFHKNGLLDKKISADPGPGGFVAPRTFWIDSEGHILILDVNLNKILKYTSDKIQFVEAINIGELNWSSPISFGIIPKENTYAHYFLHNEKNQIDNKQIGLTKDNEKLEKLYLEANSTGTIMFGSPRNFYVLNDELNFYPYFSNKIYAITSDSLKLRYELLFNNLNFPPESVFIENPGTRQFMTTISEKNYVQYMTVFETQETLYINYLIKYEKYVAIYNKNSKKVKNLKVQDITDELGLGNSFLEPISVYENCFIGLINPDNIDSIKLEEQGFKSNLGVFKDDDNPILVFYKLKE